MPRSIIGLDIGSKFIKALELTKSKDTYVITGYAHAELQVQDSIPNVLSDLFSRAGFQSRRVVTSVSGKNVVVRYVSMPMTTDEDLRSSARYELGKYIPFDVGEVVHDCQILEELPVAEGTTPEVRVVLVAARKTFIDEHISILEHAGLYPEIIDLDVFALENAFSLEQAISPSQTEEREMVPVALIDIGASKTSINITNGILSYFSREFYKAGDTLTEAISKKIAMDLREAERLKRNPGPEATIIFKQISTVIEDITHDINISLDFFENQYNQEVKTIYLTGGGSLCEGVPQTLERILQRSVIMWNPIQAFKLDLPKDARDELMAYVFQSAVCLGLASRIQNM
jgi:type IV pilus assembly protein PilM